MKLSQLLDFKISNLSKLLEAQTSINHEIKKARKEKNAVKYFYYTYYAQGASALASFDVFKGSAAYIEWLKKPFKKDTIKGSIEEFVKEQESRFQEIWKTGL